MADISFPYPVLLNESGDIAGDFKVDVNYDPSIAGFYTLEFKYTDFQMYKRQNIQ